MSEPIQSIVQNNYILQAPPPTATMFTTELEYDGDKISGYGGSAFKSGDEFPVSADEAIQYVQTNSGTINDTVTSYKTNSGTFLTAHQAISAEEWNDCYDNVNTNSGAWGGSALPISAGPGIKVNLVDNTLVFSNDETLLWSGDEIGSAFTITANEPPTNFQYIYVLGHTNDLQPNQFNFFSDTHQLTITSSMQLSDYQFTTWGEKLMNIRVNSNGQIKPEVTKERQWGTTAYTGMNSFGIYKVVGINRKQ